MPVRHGTFVYIERLYRARVDSIKNRLAPQDGNESRFGMLKIQILGGI